MSCPCFAPGQPRAASGDGREAMLPLGGVWDGLCLADPSHPEPPAETQLVRHCHLGYARHVCGRFPDDGRPDAVRFAIAADDGRSIRVAWSLERGHRPAGHGVAVYSRADAAFDAAPPQAAAAYVASYLRRKSMES